jgi:hypothetical protein
MLAWTWPVLLMSLSASVTEVGADEFTAGTFVVTQAALDYAPYR